MADEEKLREYLRKATAELQQSRRQLAALAAREAEPVAVIGIGCRFPGGVRSPEDLWDLVTDRRDVVGPLPGDRGWPREGPLAGFQGGFLNDVSRFDAAFFGISDDEARAMDPQQRLLLETAWEAVERAGLDPTTLGGTRTGVYTGLTFTGYPMVLGGNPPPAEVLDFMGVGSSSGAAAGRIAYLFGLLGPAMSVDTACSSSLVALHVASQALRRGECTLALAGGASICALPHLFLEFERRGSISSDGRSKSFAAAADGVSFSEGIGMLLLERLSDAQANGHPVLALIRGSAVNQDGATNGLASPSNVAQERVIRQALADARVGAEQVGAVEGHGVGASLGDGIEARSLIAVYGPGRPADQPLRLSSVKSNIGHTQAAGGVAGVIKTVMALRHKTFPASLHVDQPTTHADWSAGTVRLQTEAEPWVAGEHPRRAGVSCFSISGTNSHLILEEAPTEAEAELVDAGPRPESATGALPWLISAKSAPALRAQAERLRAVAESAEPRDIGHSLAFSRSTFKHRAVIVAEDRDGFAAGLAALAAGEPAPGLSVGLARGQGRLAMVFPSADDWAPGTGTGLYESFGPFAEAFDEVCEQLEAAIGRPVAERPAGPPAGTVAPGSAPGQPDQAPCARADDREAAAFAVQVACLRLIEGFDVTADVVAGHGIGEVTAALAAGILSLSDACALVAARGRLALARSESTAGGLLDSDLDDLRKVVSGLDFGPAEIPVASAGSGRVVTDEELASGDHWAAVSGAPGCLDEALLRLRDDGIVRFLHLGTAEAVQALVESQQPQTDSPDARPFVLASALVKPAQSASSGSLGAIERRTFLTALGALHAHGVPVDWTMAFEKLGAARIDLPTYPFQYRSYWLTALPGDVDGAETAHDAGGAATAPAVDQDDIELIPGFGQRRMGGFRQVVEVAAESAVQ